jgi:NAD(P)-dependent dehydrogenase (short-subunit alcohol dehydrogenase family)
MSAPSNRCLCRSIVHFRRSSRWTPLPAARIILGARSAHELADVAAEIAKLGGKTEVVQAAMDVTDETSVAHAGDDNGTGVPPAVFLPAYS